MPRRKTVVATGLSEPYNWQRAAYESPTGPDWLHEVKFDGGAGVRLFSKNGKDLTDRFPSIAATVLRLPATAGY